MISRLRTNLFLTGLVLAITAGAAIAAKPAPKPKPKPAAKTHHETVGTSQLKGGFGQIGHTYTLGKENPWNIRLNSVEYTTDTVRFGEELVFPTAEQKLLVLHFTVHNPQKGEALMRYDTLNITAVDSKENNWEFNRDFGGEKSKESINMQMKPAQKLDVYAVIPVPAAGEIPKIIFKANDELVIRYDLKGKAKPLPAPYADPNDKTGATALKVVPAEIGVYYPAGTMAIKLEGMEYSTTAIGDDDPGEDSKFLVFTWSAKNLDRRKTLLRYDSFFVTLKDADGAELDYNRVVLKASSNSELDTNLDIGQEIKFRNYFRIDNGTEPKTLTVSQAEDGRAYQYVVK